jgi:hypothetical protein
MELSAKLEQIFKENLVLEFVKEEKRFDDAGNIQTALIYVDYIGQQYKFENNKLYIKVGSSYVLR